MAKSAAVMPAAAQSMMNSDPHWQPINEIMPAPTPCAKERETR
jgi:hypothetical protein